MVRDLKLGVYPRPYLSCRCLDVLPRLLLYFPADIKPPERPTIRRQTTLTAVSSILSISILSMRAPMYPNRTRVKP